MDLAEIPNAPFRRHPWEVARARFFQRLMRDRVASGARAITVLDVGAGDGYLAAGLLATLPQESRVVCSDLNYTEIQLDTLRSTAPSGLTFSRDVPAERFDAIMLLDVLEHVPDDHAFLNDLVENRLTPGGFVLASVPAWQPLFTRHDVALGHYRRYSPAALQTLIASTRLVSVLQGGLFHSLLLPRTLSKLAEVAKGIRHAPDREVRATGETDAGRWNAGRVASGIVDFALRLDNGVSQVAAAAGASVPGLSTWVLARVP
ncbi:MAG TPA: methyltransferase domain-containing protein [Polyangiaceae bacterium]|nr:methyltransferase domain-containing protein [Polyangiaceae bacterium]